MSVKWSIEMLVELLRLVRCELEPPREALKRVLRNYNRKQPKSERVSLAKSALIIKYAGLTCHNLAMYYLKIVNNPYHRDNLEAVHRGRKADILVDCTS